MSHRGHLLGVLTGLLISVAAAPAAQWAFDNRENVNLLNSPIVDISASQVSAPYTANDLRGNVDNAESGSGIAWFSGYFSNTLDETFTINLGLTRNIKTIHTNGARNIDSATIETSPDGSTWTTQSQSATTISGNDRIFSLTSATNARYVRMTGNSYVYDTGGIRSVALENLRVFGDVGSIDVDPNLDLVSSTAGGPGGNVTLSSSGGQFTASAAEIVNDNPSSYSRHLLYDMQGGDTATLTFQNSIDTLNRFGFKASNFFSAGNTFDTSMHIRLLGSTDGTNFTTLLVDQNGGLNSSLNFFNFPTFSGMGLRLEIVSTTHADNWFTDFFAFQSVPEPGSASVLAVGMMSLIARRSRRLA